MFTFIITLIIISALLLVLVVLAQNSKGGGLSSQFGGGGTSQVMGVKRTGDLLEKMTWGLAISIIVLSLASHIYLKSYTPNPGMSSPTLERAEEQTILPPASNSLPIEGSEIETDDENSFEGLIEEEGEEE
ncbi:MAG: preprotein translocase subunit SecG [Cyclobacteriaceae bacterium]|nr:preprotein translocase subunit SecG [Cyclobacteriaceae bacterium]